MICGGQIREPVFERRFWSLELPLFVRRDSVYVAIAAIIVFALLALLSHFLCSQLTKYIPLNHKPNLAGVY